MQNGAKRKMGADIAAGPHFRRTAPHTFFEPSAETGMFEDGQGDPRLTKKCDHRPADPVRHPSDEGAAQVLLRLLAKSRPSRLKCSLSLPDVHFRAYPARASSIPSVCPAPPLRILPADGLSSRFKPLISQRFLELDRSVSTVPIERWCHCTRVVQSEFGQIFDRRPSKAVDKCG